MSYPKTDDATTIAAMLWELRQNIAENKYNVPWDEVAHARAKFLIDELVRRGRPDSQIDELIDQANLDAIKVSTDEQLLGEVEASCCFARYGGASMRDLNFRQLVVDELVLRGVAKERIYAAAETGAQEGLEIAASMSPRASAENEVQLGIEPPP